MASEFSKFFVAFLIGFGVSSCIFLKIQYDQSQAFNLLFSIEVITNQEVSNIWSDSNINEDNVLSDEALVLLFIKIYQLQEKKLMLLRNKFNIQNASYILDFYQNIGLLRSDTTKETHTHLLLPHALRRCRNILKMLHENEYEMVKMLVPNLSKNISKVDFAKLIPQYICESLRNDLCVFLDAQQRGYDPLEYLGYADRAIAEESRSSGGGGVAGGSESNSISNNNGHYSTPLEHDAGSSSPLSSYQYPSNYYSQQAGESDSLLASQNVDPNISSTSYQNQYKSLDDEKIPRRKASRQSDVFDYLHKTANL